MLPKAPMFVSRADVAADLGLSELTVNRLGSEMHQMGVRIIQTKGTMAIEETSWERAQLLGLNYWDQVYGREDDIAAAESAN